MVSDDDPAIAAAVAELRQRRREECEEAVTCSGFRRMSESMLEPCPCSREVYVGAQLVRGGVPVGLALRAHRVQIAAADPNREAMLAVERYGARVDRAARAGMGLLLHGRNGCGKTTAAVRALRAAVGRLRELGSRAAPLVRYATAPDAAAAPPPGWGGAALAVLDELGKEPGGDRAAAAVDGLIRSREGRPIIVVSNATPEELARRYGASVTSMIRALTEVDFVPVDHRVSQSWEVLE